MDNLIAIYHLHPIIDHFTIALCVAGVLADIVGYSITAIVGNRSLSARELSARLSRAAVVLLIPGALWAILSRLTEESEAERVWESISPAAQRILLTDNGPRWFLSHAVLGTYLMYPLIAVAIWRVLSKYRQPSHVHNRLTGYWQSLLYAQFFIKEKRVANSSTSTGWNEHYGACWAGELIVERSV
jgi:uncharacterized membrane protein